jgi:hypothetical protein
VARHHRGHLHIHIYHVFVSVADPGCLSRIRIFPHPGSRIRIFPHPGSRIRIFSIPDPGIEFFLSRIRIFSSRIRIFSIPDTGSASQNLSILTSVADPGYLSRIRIFPSRIRIFSIPNQGSEFFIRDSNIFHPYYRIRIKEFKFFNPKKRFSSSRKYDPGCCSSRIES